MSFLEILSSIERYWFIIIAFAGFIFYYYRKEMNKYEKWQDKYVKYVLVPFHLQHLKNPSLDIKTFIGKVEIYENVYIPSYIHYLYKINDFEGMRKILIVDWDTKNPSQKNLSSLAQSKVAGAISYGFEFLIIFMFSLTIPFVLISLFALILELIISWGNLSWNEQICRSLYVFLASIILLAVLIFTLRRTRKVYSCCYSAQIKVIKRVVKRKKNNYKKISKDLIYNEIVCADNKTKSSIESTPSE